METEALKPCPFCGHEKVRVERKRGTAGTACRSNWYREYVYCLRCDASTGKFKRPDSAVRAWNKRAD